MSTSGTFKTALMAAIAFCAGVCDAQEPGGRDKQFTISRITTAPSIDGTIGESEWADAVRVSDLHQIRPVEFAQPSERTVWYVAYDDKAHYVAVHAFDSDPDIRQDVYADVNASDLVVARVSTGVLDESSIGAILTSGDPGSNSSALANGLTVH